MKKLELNNLYSQRDNSWSSELLGYNTSQPYTIGNYGCLITSYGMYIDKNPHDVNELLKDNDGFTNGRLFIWSKCTVLGLSQIYISPKYSGPVTDHGINKIKEHIDNGRPLICEVDFNPSTVSEEMHFLLVIGHDGDKIFAADPWSGEIINLDVYGGAKRAIIQFRAYDKTLTDDTGTDNAIIQNSDNWIALLQRYNFTNNKDIVFTEIDKLVKYEDIVREKDKELEQKDKQIEEVQEQAVTLSDEIKRLQDENEDLKKDTTTVEEKVDDHGKDIQAVSDAVEELKEVKPVDQLGTIDYIKLLWKSFWK